MHHLCIVRVINVSSLEEARILAGNACEELCSEYRTDNYGIEVIREIKARDFLSIYKQKPFTEEKAQEWVKDHEFKEIYQNYMEDNFTEDMEKEIEKLWGIEFATCVFIDKIDTEYNENNELMFKIHFDICPATCLWDAACVVDDIFEEKAITKFGKGITKEISEDLRNEKVAFLQIILDASKEKDEYGRLMPVKTICNNSTDDLVSINDGVNDYPISDNDYIVFLGCKY